MSDGPRDSRDTLREVFGIAASGLRRRGMEVIEAVRTSIPAPGPEIAAGEMDEYCGSRVNAIVATVQYCLDAIECGGVEGQWMPIPPELVSHARRAARVGVRPGLLVRRFLAGQRRFMGLVGEELERSGHVDCETVLRATYRPLLDHIVASIEREHHREHERVARLPQQRRTRLVRRLLAGDLDPEELVGIGYEVCRSWHLGMIATSIAGEDSLEYLAGVPGRELLCLPDDDGTTVWAWLGGRTVLSVAELKRLFAARKRPDPGLTVGDPGYGLEGWRQTHQEARLALAVACREPRKLTRCADALPVLGALQNETIVRMFERTYVLPLNGLAKGGRPARRALRAYFEHGRSFSAAASALGISRGQVERHLGDARRTLGDQLDLTGLEIALRLEQLRYMPEVDTPQGNPEMRITTHRTTSPELPRAPERSK